MVPGRLIIFSGAGLSAESGLKTFRGTDGLWEGEDLNVVCHIQTWRRNFQRMHQFYNLRRKSCLEAEPNAAHRQIAHWQTTWPKKVVLLTQNIDRLLEKAGCRDVIHLHGVADELRCTECEHLWPTDNAYDLSGCPHCRSQWVKPNIIFFGEAAPLYQELYQLSTNLQPADLVLVIGTSGAVLPADRLFGLTPAHTILLNLEPDIYMDEQTFSERSYGPATQTVPHLDNLIQRWASEL